MEHKKQPIWDELQRQIKEFEQFQEDNKDNPFLVKHSRVVTKLMVKVLRSTGWRKRYHDRETPAVSIPKQTELPTQKHANREAPKYGGRLTAQQGSDIQALEKEGKESKEISGLLMIVEEKIIKYLKKLKKNRQPKNLIYVTNGKND